MALAACGLGEAVLGAEAGEGGVEGEGHAGAVDGFHGAAEGGGDLQEVGHAEAVGGAVGAGAVHERGVEEEEVALGERELDVVVAEPVLEGGALEGEVAFEEELAVGEEERGAGLERHVAVGDGALEGEGGGEAVDVGGEAGGLLGGHEAEVVVAVGGLGGAAGVHAVDLGGHLVAGAEPGFGSERNGFVAVVEGEALGVGEAVLLERVPDAVVGAGLGEVVAAAGRGCGAGPR